MSNQGTIVISDSDTTVVIGDDDTVVVVPDVVTSVNTRIGDVVGLAEQVDLDAEAQARVDADLGLQADIDAIVAGGGGDMLSTNNLSELTDPAVARDNLGLGDAATHPASDFANAADLLAETDSRILGDLDLQDQVDAIVLGGGAGDLLSTNNLSDLTDFEQARINLGLGTAAVEDVDFFATTTELTDLTNALGTAAYRNVGITSSDVAAGDAPQNAVDAMPTVDTTDPAKAFFTTVDVGGGEEVTFLDVTNLASLDDIGGGGTIPTAAEIPFTPAGTIAATTVQAAIEEVATEAGGGSSLLYTFTQDVASALWSVAHSLGAYVNVTVVDSLVRQVEADVQYVDANNITIGFAVPTTGQAFLS